MMASEGLVPVTDREGAERLSGRSGLQK